jgi:hypothetical protein
MGKTFAHYDHAKAPENTEQRPETDNGITEKMHFMPCGRKIEHYKKRQEDKKDPFQHAGMLI